MTTPSRDVLSGQLDRIRANGFLQALNTASDGAGIEHAFHVAIASRETNCEHILGDFRNGQWNGVGMTQIDAQHDLARTLRDNGLWKTPAGAAQLFAYGASILAANVAKVRSDFDDVTDADVIQIAADGYNEAMGRAEADAKDGGDPDRRTTGHDYGKDVLARYLVFVGLMAAAQ